MAGVNSKPSSSPEAMAFSNAAKRSHSLCSGSLNGLFLVVSMGITPGIACFGVLPRPVRTIAQRVTSAPADRSLNPTWGSRRAAAKSSAILSDVR
jgi:hypothetical protein